MLGDVLKIKKTIMEVVGLKSRMRKRKLLWSFV